MKTPIRIGDTNQFGIKVVGGPYRTESRGEPIKWDFLCPHCLRTFPSPTTKFATAKSCYFCRGKVRRSSSEDSTWSYLYAGIKGRQAARTKGFDLSKEQFIELSSTECFYCGEPPKETNGRHDWHPRVLANGLDRIDSSKGYLVGNVVPSCGICNVAKLAMKREDFFAWVIKVARHQQLTMSPSMSTHILV